MPALFHPPQKNVSFVYRVCPVDMILHMQMSS